MQPGLMLAAATLLVASAAVSSAQAAAIRAYEGMCEPSAAVALPEGSFGGVFIVADDESNVLRAYAEQGGEPLAVEGADLDEWIDPAPGDEMDIEGATWLGGRAYWIGSHSRAKGGKLRKERWQFFSTELTADGESRGVRLAPEASSHDLLAAFAELDAAIAASIEIDDDDDKDLAPDNGGFNIEGLTAAADGASMLIGLRSPMAEGGQAMAIRFVNPRAVLETGAEPELGAPMRLDLGGRGIRSMEYVASVGAYFIVAGPIAGEAPFEIYSWSGDAAEAPTPVAGSAAALAEHDDFTPEAMILDAAGENALLLSDDGDSCDETAPTFRSMVLPLR